MQGTMIWFNPAKQHGFVRTDEGERLRLSRAGSRPGWCSEIDVVARASASSESALSSKRRGRSTLRCCR